MPARSDRPFSRRGDAPTAYEVTLLNEAAQRAAVDSVWIIIAARIGADALAVVLDEIGGEKVSVPTREGFFRALHEPVRDARIAELLARGVPGRVIAEQTGISPGRVSQIAAGLKRRGRG
jgi:hypothetical protein